MFRNYLRYVLLLIGITFIPPLNGSLYHQLASSPYKSLQLFDHVINHPVDNNINTNNNNQNSNFAIFNPTAKYFSNRLHYLPPSPTRTTYPISSSSAQTSPPSSSSYNQKFISPIIGNQILDELSYFGDGRILKQYLVMEDYGQDVLDENHPFNHLRRILNNPFNNNPFVPFLPTNVNVPQQYVNNDSRQNLGFPLNNQQQTVNNNQKTVALGSGSLGYIRLPNGAVYLGSGSLGYINPAQRVENIFNRIRSNPNASPLTFGQAPL